MNYLIEMDGTVDFAPSSEIVEIMQNLRTIISTTKWSVPLDRDFGISGEYVDKPMESAKAYMAAEIIQAINQYEPRVTVEEISFTATLDGVLKPRIEVSINGTEESA